MIERTVGGGFFFSPNDKALMAEMENGVRHTQVAVVFVEELEIETLGKV